MKNIIYNVIVSLLSGIGIFFIVSGVNYQLAGWYKEPECPIMIGIGTAILVGAVLLYIQKCKK